MSASPTDVIIGSCVVVVGTTVIRNAHNKTKAGTTFKPIVFGFMLAIALLAIAIVAPGFSKGLAYLALVGAFAVNGPAIFEIIRSM